MKLQIVIIICLLIPSALSICFVNNGNQMDSNSLSFMAVGYSAFGVNGKDVCKNCNSRNDYNPCVQNFIFGNVGHIKVCGKIKNFNVRPYSSEFECSNFTIINEDELRFECSSRYSRPEGCMSIYVYTYDKCDLFKSWIDNIL